MRCDVLRVPSGIAALAPPPYPRRPEHCRSTAPTAKLYVPAQACFRWLAGQPGANVNFKDSNGRTVRPPPPLRPAAIRCDTSRALLLAAASTVLRRIHPLVRAGQKV